MTYLGRLRRFDFLLFVAGLTASSAVVALYAEMFHEVTRAAHSGVGSGIFYGQLNTNCLIRVFTLFLLIMLLFALLFRFGKKILQLFYQYRWLLACTLIILLTVCKISGSSIAYMSNYVGGISFQGVVLGIPRAMRSDEWNVFTPLAFSQAHSGYAARSDLPRALSTDMTMVYAQPSWAIATLFRPFLWGFMLLGSEMGLAFFWSARLILLLLVSFEFGRWFTHDDRWTSATYALLVGFGPITQWWFAVNGTAELLIFGQSVIILFDKYLRMLSSCKRCTVALLIAYCLGCFIMVVYPALQVPLIYVIGAVCLWALIHYCLEQRAARMAGQADKRTFIIQARALLIALLTITVLILASLYQARDAIRSEGSTLYPGNRRSTGGGIFPALMSYGSSIFFPLDAENVPPNAPEQAFFFCLFPLGILLGLFAVWKTRDGFLVSILLADAFLYIYAIWGMPIWLCQLTLMGRTTSGRVKLVTGLVELILIFRSITDLRLDRYKSDLRREGAGRKNSICPHNNLLPAVLVCLVFTALIALGTKFSSAYRLRHIFFIILILVIFFMLVALWGVIVDYKYARKLLISSIAVIVLAGICVNPIQHGASSLTNSPVIAMTRQRIDHIRSDKPVAVLTDNSVIGQALVANGIPTINSVNTMPTLERWHHIDPDTEYEEVYNRYAYIDAEVSDKQSSSFELIFADHFRVCVAVDDLPKIDATYVLTRKNLNNFSTSHTNIEKVDSTDGWNLYQVRYSGR